MQKGRVVKLLLPLSLFVSFTTGANPAHSQAHRLAKVSPAQRAYAARYKALMQQFKSEMVSVGARLRAEPQFPNNATRQQKHAIIAEPYDQVALVAERSRLRMMGIVPPPAFKEVHQAQLNVFALRDTHKQHAAAWRSGKKADVKATSDAIARKFKIAQAGLKAATTDLANKAGLEQR